MSLLDKAHAIGRNKCRLTEVLTQPGPSAMTSICVPAQRAVAPKLKSEKAKGPGVKPDLFSFTEHGLDRLLFDTGDQVTVSASHVFRRVTHPGIDKTLIDSRRAQLLTKLCRSTCQPVSRSHFVPASVWLKWLLASVRLAGRAAERAGRSLRPACPWRCWPSSCFPCSRCGRSASCCGGRRRNGRRGRGRQDER